MNAEMIAQAAQSQTPDTWKITWSGDNETFAAIDTNGLVVFTSESQVFDGTGMDDEEIIAAILWATKTRLRQFETWDGMKRMVYPSARSTSEVFLVDETTKLTARSPYQGFVQLLAPGIAAVPSANAESHVTLIPDQTLRNLGVSKAQLWQQSLANLTTWFRSREWSIEVPARVFEILGNGPIPVFTGDPRCSAIPMIPDLLREVAHEMGMPENFYFSMPVEGGVLFSNDTTAGRAALESLTNVIYLKAAFSNTFGVALSPDIFYLVDNAVISTQKRH